MISYGMKRLLGIAFFCLTALASANDQMRLWTFVSGTTKTAEIVSFDEAKKVLTLRLENQEILKIDEADLSALDRAWILQWMEQDEEARALVDKLGGSFSSLQTTGNYPSNYYVYHAPLPPGAPAPPMLILFHPNGDGVRGIFRYVEAAAATGFTLVSMDHFRNANDSATEDGFDLRFAEALPQIEENVPHDPQRIFLGGMSGSAMRAYTYSVKFERPWAGVLANGGWLGPDKETKKPFPAMRVAMVNGDKDRGANGYIDRDTKILQGRGCTVSIHAFEGGHQMPPPSVAIKAMKWLLEQ